jgi:hypothetical protein
MAQTGTLHFVCTLKLIVFYFWGISSRKSYVRTPLLIFADTHLSSCSKYLLGCIYISVKKLIDNLNSFQNFHFEHEKVRRLGGGGIYLLNEHSTVCTKKVPTRAFM